MFDFGEQGGDGSLPSPVFGFVYHRGGQLSTVPCGFIYNLVWRFGVGDGVRYPPLSRGSKLHNLTCGVEKTFFGHPRIKVKVGI